MSARFTMIEADVLDEIRRAHAKFGNQFDVPDGTMADFTEDADALRAETQRAFAAGEGTWLHILSEEMYEAAAETDPMLLRAELLQVAAVAMRWIDAIDCRTPLPAPALNPDCRVSKHGSCAGDAWDDVTDSPTTCACDCHRPVTG